MTDASTSSSSPAPGRHVGRRDVLRLGASTITLGALVAACGTGGGGPIGRVGAGEPAEVLPDATVNDGVLLRTGSSIHHSIAAAYDQAIASRDLLAAEHVALATRLHDNHLEQATAFEKLTTGEGATPWTCGNPRFDAAIIGPALERITKGREAKADAKAVGPSDDPKRDVLNLLYALESMSSAMGQAFVPQFSKPELRRQAMVLGVGCARQAALVALAIDPQAYVSAGNAALAETSEASAATTTTVQNIATPTSVASGTAAPPPTEIPPVSALPAAFGQLGAQLLVVGAGDENGVRLKVNVETPAQNSFVYDYMTPSC